MGHSVSDDRDAAVIGDIEPFMAIGSPTMSSEEKAIKTMVATDWGLLVLLSVRGGAHTSLWR